MIIIDPYLKEEILELKRILINCLAQIQKGERLNRKDVFHLIGMLSMTSSIYENQMEIRELKRLAKLKKKKVKNK
jgi:hypothetical protein